MRKLHIVLLIMFAAGVLLGGIGTGIALGEYSEFAYVGEVLLGEEDLVTKDFDYTFTPEEDTRVLLCHFGWGDPKKNSLLVEDASIPAGVIRYRVTYNAELLRMELLSWDAEPEEELEQEIWGEGEKAEETLTQTEPETVALEGEITKTEGEEEKKSRKLTYLELRPHYFGNDMDLVLKNKDRMMEAVKQRKFADYQIANVEQVEILVNPQTVPYLKDESR